MAGAMDYNIGKEAEAALKLAGFEFDMHTWNTLTANGPNGWKLMATRAGMGTDHYTLSGPGGVFSGIPTGIARRLVKEGLLPKGWRRKKGGGIPG